MESLLMWTKYYEMLTAEEYDYLYHQQLLLEENDNLGYPIDMEYEDDAIRISIINSNNIITNK